MWYGVVELHDDRSAPGESIQATDVATIKFDCSPLPTRAWDSRDLKARELFRANMGHIKGFS